MTRAHLIASLPSLRREAHARHEAECRSFINRERVSVIVAAQYEDGSTELMASK